MGGITLPVLGGISLLGLGALTLRGLGSITLPWMGGMIAGLGAYRWRWGLDAGAGWHSRWTGAYSRR